MGSKCNHFVSLSSEQHIFCTRCAMAGKPLVDDLNARLMEVQEMRQMLAMDRPYLTLDCLAVMQRACVHFVTDHDCDSHGWETVKATIEAAKTILDAAGYKQDDDGHWFHR